MFCVLAAVLALLGAPAAAAAAAAAPPVVAVLSSDLDAYREALAGFNAGFGQPVHGMLAEDRAPLPEGTRVVAAFGGRAASKPYPSGVFVISCLTPGLPREPRFGSRVRMVPTPGQLLSGIRGAQPAARVLAVLWSNPGFEDYARELRGQGARLGLRVRLVPTDGDDELPDALRSIRGEADAVWVAPDPDLINERSFALLTEFSRSARLPLYAPTLELVKEGATAAIAVSFYEAGRAAGLAARRALAGEALPGRIYAEKVESAFDGEQAARDGLQVSTDVSHVGVGTMGR